MVQILFIVQAVYTVYLYTQTINRTIESVFRCLNGECGERVPSIHSSESDEIREKVLIQFFLESTICTIIAPLSQFGGVHSIIKVK